MRKIPLHHVCVAGLTFLFIGCAGRNFVRPSESELILGRTSKTEITNRFGAPFRTGRIEKNGRKIEQLSYAYATAMTWEPQLKPARAEMFSFADEKLVGYVFSSSFKEDGTDFDTTNVVRVTKGVTTRAEVEKLFGPPGGKCIYPIIGDRESEGISYHYNQFKTVPFGAKIYDKLLLITVNKHNIVSDVEFIESGER